MKLSSGGEGKVLEEVVLGSSAEMVVKVVVVVEVVGEREKGRR